MDKGNKVVKLWVNVIRDNRDTTKGIFIQYMATRIVNGEIEVEIEEEDLEVGVRYLENSLIMYVIRVNLSMHAMKNYMSKYWNLVQRSIEIRCS